MTLVDELKAALPGWAVKGHKSEATAVDASMAITVRCLDDDFGGVYSWLYIGVEIVAMVYRSTVPAAIDGLREGLNMQLANNAEQMKRNRAALNALGGGK